MPLHLDRLAEAVRTRRAYLGLAQGGLAEHGGPSVVTVGQIERCQIERPQAVTLSRLDKALQWERGSAARVLHGGDPEEIARTYKHRSGPTTVTVGSLKEMSRADQERAVAEVLAWAGQEGLLPDDDR